MGAEKLSADTDHVDVSRPLKQLPFAVWERLLIPVYVPLCQLNILVNETG